MPKLIYNPAAFGPGGGKTITTGVPASSGVLSPAGPKAPPAKATYTFPKAGVFQLICNVHPGHDRSAVTVKPAGTPVPLTAAQVTAKALTDIAAAWAKAKPLAAAAGADEHGLRGRRQHDGDPRLLPAGPEGEGGHDGARSSTARRVRCTTSPSGPTKYLLAFSKKTDFLPTGPTSSKNQVTPLYPFGTEPKGGYTYDGTNHGNGFFSTPLVGRLAQRAAAAARRR